jgi:hypothetical protein
LADYVAKHGKVTKEVFDPYWKSLSREELKVCPFYHALLVSGITNLLVQGWEEQSAAAKKGTTT